MSARRWLVSSGMVLAATVSLSAATPPAVNPGDKDYRLVWSDEFDKDGPPDAKDWNFERGFVRNQELQWYQPENATCEKGILTIEGRKEEKPNPNYVAGSTRWQTNREKIEYTSASMSTRESHAWLYGRFEMRARIDTRMGSWPAFWTLGFGRWPAGGEVDIMEFYNHRLLANFGWAGAPATRGAGGGGAWNGATGGGVKWNAIRKPIADMGKEWSSEFHVWRMDWDEKAMVIYVDNNEINRQDLGKTFNGGREGEENNPFHKPMYMILNQAIGGTQGGDPSGTQFPLKYEVDFVRVYQTPAQEAASKAALATTRPARRGG